MVQPDQKRKLFVLMVNMFIAIGSFGIIIPIMPAYLVSIGQGGTAAGLMIAILQARNSSCPRLQVNGPTNTEGEK